MSDPIETLISAAADAVAPSVVRIGRNHRGTGVVVAPNIVLTNAHNLRDRTTTVWFADGTSADAEVRATDTDGDLIALDVDTRDAPAVSWSDAEARLGQQVVAVGVDPGAGPRATVGRISATGRTFRGPARRQIDGAIEHTAPVRRGGSGGPIVDVDNKVVGVSTHRTRGGLYLALPTDERFRSKVESLVAGNDIARPRLGVALAPADVAARLRRSVGLEERPGLLVRGVEDDSPAAAADIRSGDLIVTAAGNGMETMDDLYSALAAADASLVVGIVRGADELDVEVALG